MTTATAISIPCPNGCGRTVASADKDIHYCVIREFGETYREYLGCFDGEIITRAANNSDAELGLNDYTLRLCEQGLIDPPVDPNDNGAPIGPDWSDDPFADPRTPEEIAWDTTGWAECEGGWEKFGPHPFDESRTVRHFRPRLFSAAVPDGTPSD